MSPDALELAAQERVYQDEDERIDASIMLLLARYEAVTADPRKMGYLRFLLRHYSQSATPWTSCMKDNLKRFGPKTKGLCAVVKDAVRQSTGWRGHPERDHGSPGVAIAEVDKGAANPPWGPWMVPWEAAHGKLSADEYEVWATLLDAGSRCDPCRVMLGLDEAPEPSAYYLSGDWRGDLLVSEAV